MCFFYSFFSFNRSSLNIKSVTSAILFASLCLSCLICNLTFQSPREFEGSYGYLLNGVLFLINDLVKQSTKHKEQIENWKDNEVGNIKHQYRLSFGPYYFDLWSGSYKKQSDVPLSL